METINEIIAGVEEPPESFEQYLTQYADRVGDLVNSFIPKGTHADMDRYLYDPLISYSQNGGKRHRPLICFAACRAVGGDMARATSAAAAIEHFHTAALIHDDIADEAELRRGEPCMHLTEGMGLAINAGDLALSLVNGTVVSDKSLDDATKVRVITELIDMTRRTIEGQALDIGWATAVTTSRLKTIWSWPRTRLRIIPERCPWQSVLSSAAAPRSRSRRCATTVWTPASRSRSRTIC